MDFFDREQECEDLWSLFGDGKNVLMLAPRRIGKTEMLHQLSEQSKEKNYRAVMIDLEGYRDEKQFIYELCSAIQQEIGAGKSLLASVTQRIKQVVGAKNPVDDWRQLLLIVDWHEFAQHLLQELDTDGQPWMIMVDELPIFILALLNAGPEKRAHEFLHWLRNLRQKFRNIRWLYTGSIGLDAVARRESLEGALVDMEIFPLKPFTDPTATAFVKVVIARRNCAFENDDAPERMLASIGWLAPFYLEKIAEMACRRMPLDDIITKEVIEAAERDMLSHEHRLYWSTWREHLDKNFIDPVRTHLYTVLSAIARDPEGATIDTLLNQLSSSVNVDRATVVDLLHTLEADGYVLRCANDPSRYRFRMNLLRLWWLSYIVS